MSTAHEQNATARVVAVNGYIVTIETSDKGKESCALVKNEVVYVISGRKQDESVDEMLMSEILRVHGKTADIQVFEDTRGIAVGDYIIQTGQLLSAELGPGLLGQIYDGLQNPLASLARLHGTFLQRGVQMEALDRSETWSCIARARVGDVLRAG